MSGAAARMPLVYWTREGEGAYGQLIDPSQKPGQNSGQSAGQNAGQNSWQKIDASQKKGAPKRNAVQVPLSSVQFYRRYTEMLLRRYMQVSMRMGRVPSVLGNCAFRGRVSSRPVESFEDAVIFVYDVERCLGKLCPEDRELISRIALQEYTQAEAADLTGQSQRSVVRKYGEAVDTLTRIFLEKDLLEVESLYPGQ